MTWFVYKKKKESQIDPKWNFVVIVIKINARLDHSDIYLSCSFNSYFMTH